MVDIGMLCMLCLDMLETWTGCTLLTWVVAGVVPTTVAVGRVLIEVAVPGNCYVSHTVYIDGLHDSAADDLWVNSRIALENWSMVVGWQLRMHTRGRTQYALDGCRWRSSLQGQVISLGSIYLGCIGDPLLSWEWHGGTHHLDIFYCRLFKLLGK